ncbi:neurofilament heavy polypeptide-like [Penaeus japonicus]|uniref:neurofilament heavy polypeptide-like n=1 Tax=Penaeus japonicus TaxID=27405 RepID=UPI001C70ED2C|nr:neurofilament heavy polypeptide-like [Penaeus japonicus]
MRNLNVINKASLDKTSQDTLADENTTKVEMIRKETRDVLHEGEHERSVSQSTVKPRTMRNYLDEARELGLRGMQVLHYIEQQEKIRREKEERAYQEREEQRQEAEKRRHEKLESSRALAERQLKKQRFLRRQEERALEERQRQKKDAQKAQQKDVGSPSWTCPEGCVCLSFPGWNRCGPRVESWATQELPGECRRSEELPATNYHPAEIVRSREDLSQQWIRRPNGQEQRVHPESDRRAKRARSTDQRPRSVRPRMEVSAGKARAQEAQSAETKAPVKAWAPEEPPAEARASEEQPAEARAPEEPLPKVRAPEESPAEARAPEEPSPETRRCVHRRSNLQGRVHRRSRPQRRVRRRSRAGKATNSSKDIGENDDLADRLPGIGRPLQEAIDVKCSPRGPSRMRCTSEDPPVESRSPEELLAERESLPEEVFPAQLPRTSTQLIVTGRRRDRDRRSSADDGRAGPGATSPPSSGFRGRDVRPCWKRSLA